MISKNKFLYILAVICYILGGLLFVTITLLLDLLTPILLTILCIISIGLITGSSIYLYIKRNY